VKNKLGDNYVLWQTQYGVVDYSNNVLRKNDNTAKIVDKSKEVISVYNSFYDIAKANMKNLDSKVSDSAGRIVNVFDNRGKIYKMSINDQISTVTTALQDFNGEFFEDIKNIGGEIWVEQLARINTEYIDLYDKRLDEEKKKLNINMKSARIKLTEYYRNLCLIVNSLVLMEGEEKYGDFIDEINNINKKFGVRKTSDSDSEDVDVIDEEDDMEEEDVIDVPETPATEYPDAIEWVEGFGVANAQDGMIFYIMVDGKKVYYKLLDRAGVGFVPGGTKYQELWEKLN
jgi:hypothetical protein